MSTKIEYTGSDVAEAIKNACKKLNAAQDQLDIDIISTGSTGIFGLGRRKAKITVSLKNSAGGAGNSNSTKGRSSHRSGRGRKPAREGATQQPQRPPAKPLSDDAIEAIKNDLMKILNLMTTPSTVEVEQKNGKISMHISSEHIEQIIGPAGQTLDSIQYLLRKIAGKKLTERVRITLDAGDFRESRAKELEATAAQLAKEVKEDGRTKSIPSLNPAERRIVHMVLQADNTIRSRSVGDGLYKKILIYLPGKNNKRSGRSNSARSHEDKG